MAEYKTPGVYVEEISTFPASVVRVATAVPVFVGYTAAVPAGLTNVAIKVKSMIEYQQVFGGEPTSSLHRTITVSLGANNAVTDVALSLQFYLYNSLKHFYANGGGDCYIMSVGVYNDDSDATRRDAIIAALPALAEVDEPTLVLTPDAFAFALASDLGTVQAAVLAHCAKMQDRFGILDVKTGADVASASLAFRTAVGSQNLSYGAAYFPPIKSSIGPDGPVDASSFTLAAGTLESVASSANDPVLLDYAKAQSDLNKLNSLIAIGPINKTFGDWFAATQKAINDGVTLPGNAAAARNHLKTNVLTPLNAMAGFLYSLQPYAFKLPALQTAKNTLVGAAGLLKTYVQTMYKVDLGYAELGTVGGGGVYSLTGAFATLGVVSGYAAPVDYGLLPALLTVPGDVTTVYGPVPGLPTVATEKGLAQNAIAYLQGSLTNLKAAYDALVTFTDRSFATTAINSTVLSGIVAGIRGAGYLLPPSGAVAGLYASVDAARGVWKAPANVSLNAVTDVMKLSADELDKLNISADTGKSINAIRLFRGQGILVYGARTLAGNDNEWRYVPVRRLFIMVEESVKKASEPFVFEPNDAHTWLKIKGMIESFLVGLWRDGALAGAVPKDAFFVKVGLGQTMTAQDVLEGRLIVEIGMAAVRPAEFVILKFMHKLQES